MNSDKLNELLHRCITSARDHCGHSGKPNVVVSPYRFNPLGAHVDHQGGHVLARTIDQYTLLPFWQRASSSDISLTSDRAEWTTRCTTFKPSDSLSGDSWIRYAQASAKTLASCYPLSNGLTGYVSGTCIGAGLSSSASVILSYLTALAYANNIQLAPAETVELARQVENDHMGLNNGIQDQMSIMYGQPDALSLLNMRKATASAVLDPETAEDVRWIVCYSGFSRELINSGFNTRVEECRQAANSLDSNAKILGDVASENSTIEHLDKLPKPLSGRARHFYSEVQRVSDGVSYWQNGDWEQFGRLMNESCHSSITQYESGSQPLIDLHEIASGTSGVLGSRFSGGGYGGCLLILAKCDQAHTVAEVVLEQYLQRYPDKADNATTFLAFSEGHVRIVDVSDG